MNSTKRFPYSARLLATPGQPDLRLLRGLNGSTQWIVAGVLPQLIEQPETLQVIRRVDFDLRPMFDRMLGDPSQPISQRCRVARTHRRTGQREGRLSLAGKPVDIGPRPADAGILQRKTSRTREQQFCPFEVPLVRRPQAAFNGEIQYPLQPLSRCIIGRVQMQHLMVVVTGIHARWMGQASRGQRPLGLRKQLAHFRGRGARRGTFRRRLSQILQSGY